jgi:glycosyltransferase involved in cell wall biosynthesis
VIGRRADLVICPSNSTIEDLVALGVDRSRLRLVPLGVRPRTVADGERRRVRRTYGLPDEFVLFVGTREPRKNLARLVEAMRLRTPRQPLVVVGADGWGELGDLGRPDDEVRFLGFVPGRDRDALYAAATVFAYPSEREGFGLPVAEAMASGTPVVTSRGTSTEEVAGGAAVLVDPFDPADIARGLDDALDRRSELVAAGYTRAADLSWDAAAERTLDVYRELGR